MCSCRTKSSSSPNVDKRKESSALFQLIHTYPFSSGIQVLYFLERNCLISLMEKDLGTSHECVSISNIFRFDTSSFTL